MNKNKKRISFRKVTSQRLKIKTSLKFIALTGSSALLLTICFLLYLNFSKVEISNAGISHDRIIPSVRTQAEINVKTLLITQPNQQPAGRGQDIINKRSVVADTNPDQH